MSTIAAKLMVEVGADTSAAESGLKSFESRMKSAAKSMSVTGGVMTAGITAPLVMVAKDALGKAADYESAMSMIQYSTQASTSEMTAMSAQALQLGADSVFSANEVANAQLALGKAGMKSNKIIKAMPGIIDLAAAADMELAEAAETTSDILNMWGLEADKSTEIANMLAGAANATTAEVADFSMGIKQSGAVLSSYGVPLDDTLTMMGLLANAGLKNSDAGTSLKTMYMSLAAPTEKAAGILKKLNVAIYDGSGVMRSSEAIIGDLNSAMSSLSAADRNAAMKDIFGTDGMRAANILMENTGQAWTDMNEQINAEGNASGMAAARMSGLSGALEGLSGSVDTFLLGAAQPFLGMLAEWVTNIGDAIDKFGELPEPMQTATLAIVGLAAAAGPALLVLGAMAGALSAIGLVGGLAILAIAGLALAWGLNLGDIQTKTAEAIPIVQEWLGKAATAATEMGTAISTAFSNTTFPTAEQLWADFQAGDFQKIATTITSTAYELMVNLNTELKITGSVEELKGKIKGLIGDLTAGIEGLDFGAAGTKITQKITDLTDSINNLDLTGIDWKATLTNILLAPLGAAIKGITWVIGSTEFQGLKDAVIGAIGTIPWGELGSAFAELATAVGTQISTLFSDVGSDLGIKPIDLTDLMDSVTESINNQNWSSVGSNLVKAIAGGISSVMSADVTWAENFANGLAAQVRGSIAGVEWGELDTSFVGLADAIRAAIYGVVGGMSSVIGPALDKVSAAISAQVSSWASAIRSQFTDIKVSWDWGDGPEWAEVIPPLDWSEFTVSLDWGTLADPIAWPDWIPAITWGSFVPNVDWGSFVPSIDWGSFVPDVSWDTFIPSFSWGDWVPTLDWGRFIPSWLSGGGGSDSSSLSSSGSIGGNAAGTSYWRGGPTWVGEEGPEIIDLPRGSRVYTNDESMAMTSGMTVNISVASLNSDMDIHSLAMQVAREIARRTR